MTPWQGRLQGCHWYETVNMGGRLVRTFQKSPQPWILGRACLVFAFLLWDNSANRVSCDHSLQKRERCMKEKRGYTTFLHTLWVGSHNDIHLILYSFICNNKIFVEQIKGNKSAPADLEHLIKALISSILMSHLSLPLVGKRAPSLNWTTT